MSYMDENDLTMWYSYLVGKTRIEVRRMVEHQYHVRVVREDGVDKPDDGTYIENRMNIEITNSRLTKVLYFG